MLSNHAIIKQGGTEISDGIVFKSINANGYVTEVDFYGENIPVRCFGYTTANANPFGAELTTINCKRDINVIGVGAFSWCKKLASLPSQLLSAQTIGQNAFWNCAALQGSYVFPNVTELNGSIFRDCSLLEEMYFPKAVKLNGVSGYGKKLTVGSVGNGVVSMAYDWLQYNSRLTDLTVFCVGSKVDGYLRDCRRYAGGATATIIFKASEDTTYGGETYRAGETIISSTPT